jgi:hypothetical protein
LDVLVDALWGQDPPTRPGDQVAVLMSRLRSVLGKERIEYRDGGYLLRADWLDATELAALTDEAHLRPREARSHGCPGKEETPVSVMCRFAGT